MQSLWLIAQAGAGNAASTTSTPISQRQTTTQTSVAADSNSAGTPQGRGGRMDPMPPVLMGLMLVFILAGFIIRKRLIMYKSSR